MNKELPITLKLQKEFFTTKKQEEFLDNYLAIKGGDDSTTLPDKEVFLALKDVYEETYSPSCFEVKMSDYVIDEISDGGRVDDALSPFLHDDIVMAFKATIEVGKTEFGLRQVIKNISQQTKLKSAFNKKIRGGLFIFLLGVSFVLGVSSFALPAMLEMINERDLDELATAYLHLGRFINDNGKMLVVFIITVFFLYKYSLPNVFGSARKNLESIPLIGIFYQPYKSFSANRFFNMLTLLKSSKLSLRQSLEILETKNTPFMTHHIERMLDMTSLGVADLEQLDTGLLTPRLRVRLKSAGIRSDGKLDDVFMTIASKASEDFERGLSNTGDQIKTWLTLSGVAMCVFSVLVTINMLLAIALSIK